MERGTPTLNFQNVSSLLQQILDITDLEYDGHNKHGKGETINRKTKNEFKN